MKKVLSSSILAIILAASTSHAFAQTEIPKTNAQEETKIITPASVSFSWASTNVSSSIFSKDAFTLTSSKSSIDATIDEQGGTGSTVLVEYRLYKKNSSGAYVDTGLYQNLKGTYTLWQTGPGYVSWYNVPAGTYKVKITNKSGSGTQIYSNGSFSY